MRKTTLSLAVGAVILLSGCFPTPTRQPSSTSIPPVSKQPATPVSPTAMASGGTPAPESLLTSMQNGITLMLTNLETSSTSRLTYLDFMGYADPVWGLSYNSLAQVAMIKQPPTIVDGDGKILLPSSAGGEKTKMSVDPRTGIASFGEHFVFQPISSSHLVITLPLTVDLVRATEPIRLSFLHPDQTQSLPIDQQLVFGTFSTKVKSAQWNNMGKFEVTLDASLQEGNLMLGCLYLSADPQEFQPGENKCNLADEIPGERTGTLQFSSQPDFSNPVDVWVAADIIFLKPFTFTWIRSK